MEEMEKLYDQGIYKIDYKNRTAIVNGEGLKVIEEIIEKTGDDKSSWTVIFRPNYEYEELVKFMWDNRGKLKGL